MADKRRPSREESELWRAVTADVKRTDRDPAIAPEEQEPERPKKPAAKKPARPLRPAAPPAAPPKPDLAHGTAAGVDKRTLTRFRRGQMEIEATLDLHGHTQDSAHRALDAFIKGHAAAGRRCVIVVTGKGRDGDGVLRAEAPRWLNEPDLRQHVLAFSHARPADGGDGALYVLLKRKRPRLPGKS